MAHTNDTQSASQKGPMTEKSAVALREEATQEFWRTHDTFLKSIKQNEHGKEFVFYDGPPFATGQPHYGHILAGTMKDVIPRYKTMRGFNVRRQWGWDCHGLPVENIIEKELGLGSKKDIIDYGIEKFNEAACGAVMRYADDWKKIVPRTGRWINMEADYKTMDTSYTESVWWAFKELYNKGLVYEGFKAMQVCPRCDTTLSNFEVNQGYKDITDISVYAKFQIKGKPNTFFLAWTTTPWTLPGNVALAVGPDIDYVKIEVGENYYILAKARLSLIKEEYKITEEFKGKDYNGTEYEPVFDYYKNADLKHKSNGWKVYSADFVTTEDGTGIVHIAPAFGNDDYELLQKENLPFIQHVTSTGLFKPEVIDFAGQPVKPKDDHQKADIEIIKNLAHRGLLFAKEKLVHSYPHCWRCETPLLNYATSSWFVKVTAIKDKLVSENKKVDWIPENVRDGRFGKWLEGAKDWAISRSRFWGAPIPVWRCEDCKKDMVIGSIQDLKDFQPPHNTIFLMRHGEASNNVDNIVSSDFKTNHHTLTEKGIEQVRTSAQALRKENIDVIIASPFLRTKHTAEIVAETLGMEKSSVIVDESIREINAGDFSGRSVDEYHAFFGSDHERFVKRPQNGETYTDLKARMTKFLYELNKKYTNKKIVIVSHDSPLWLLNAGVEGMSESQALTLRGTTKFFFNNAEIRKLDFDPLPHNAEYELDLHRPYIDDITLTCSSCAGEARRIPEVFDCWFESGSMPFAQFHYPFENKDQFDPHSLPLIKKSKGYPADFIAEGLDQTRGWFYTLIILGTALFGKSPYRNVIVNGIILAEDGRKMSKSLKNYPDVSYVIDRYGADAMRYYLMTSPAVRAEDLRFSEKGVDEVYKKNILRVENVLSFLEMYGAGDTTVSSKSDNILDRWIIARLQEISGEMTKGLENYELDRGAWPVEKFVDDLSTWYVRRSRDRFKSENADDRTKALQTTRFVLKEFAKLIAPYMPFLAEEIFQKIRSHSDKESVHLETWPEANTFDEKLLQDMNDVRKIVTLGLEARSKAGIKVRQPLAKLTIQHSIPTELLRLIVDEVNVKEVVADETLNADVVLDTTLTEALREEGQFRELLRFVQDMRKKAGLNPQDRVTLLVETSEEGKMLMEKFASEFKRIAGVERFEFSQADGEEIKIENLIFKLKI